MNAGPIPAPGPMRWLFPNGVIDARPTFTPNTFRNWRREVECRRAAQVVANQTQLISKIGTVSPLNIRMEVLSYLESTESNIDSLSLDMFAQALNVRYGETDSARAWTWLSSFTEFDRRNTENSKDSWVRFGRFAASLNSRGLNLSDPTISHRATHDVRIREEELPILMAALGTFPNPTSITPLRELPIKMYEARRVETDSSEVYHEQNVANYDEKSDPHERQWGRGSVPNEGGQGRETSK